MVSWTSLSTVIHYDLCVHILHISIWMVSVVLLSILQMCPTSGLGMTYRLVGTRIFWQMASVRRDATLKTLQLLNLALRISGKGRWLYCPIQARLQVWLSSHHTGPISIKIFQTLFKFQINFCLPSPEFWWRGHDDYAYYTDVQLLYVSYL